MIFVKVFFTTFFLVLCFFGFIGSAHVYRVREKSKSRVLIRKVETKTGFSEQTLHNIKI